MYREFLDVLGIFDTFNILFFFDNWLLIITVRVHCWISDDKKLYRQIQQKPRYNILSYVINSPSKLSKECVTVNNNFNYLVLSRDQGT